MAFGDERTNRFTLIARRNTQKMEKQFKITSAQHYEDTMITIFEMQEQEEPLSKAQLTEMEMMMKAAEKYEAEEL